MYIVTFIALITIAVIFTIIFTSMCAKNEDITIAGVALLAIYLVFSMAFQMGAEWQHQDTIEKYNLTPKINSHVP